MKDAAQYENLFYAPSLVYNWAKCQMSSFCLSWVSCLVLNSGLVGTSYQFPSVGNLMENVYLVLPIRQEDTIARFHAAMGTVNDGILQNVCESIICKANKCTEDYLSIYCKYK
jgi:hypothetical protein